ncbi:MAG: effector-associated constant component EACC1 [Methylobacter sp.]
MNKLIIQVTCDEVDPSELDAATRRLRAELSAVEGCEVSQPNATIPVGVKALDAVLLGQLLLSAIGSGGIAVTLISVLRDWLTRHNEYKIRIKCGENEIELSGSDPEKLKSMLIVFKPMLMDDA